MAAVQDEIWVVSLLFLRILSLSRLFSGVSEALLRILSVDGFLRCLRGSLASYTHSIRLLPAQSFL